MDSTRLEESQTLRCHKHCGKHSTPVYADSFAIYSYENIPIVSLIETDIIIFDKYIRNGLYPMNGSVVCCDASSLLMLGPIKDFFEECKSRTVPMIDPYVTKVDVGDFDPDVSPPYILLPLCFVAMYQSISTAIWIKSRRGNNTEVLYKAQKHLRTLKNIDDINIIVRTFKEAKQMLLEAERLV